MKHCTENVPTFSWHHCASFFHHWIIVNVTWLHFDQWLECFIVGHMSQSVSKLMRVIDNFSFAVRKGRVLHSMININQHLSVTWNSVIQPVCSSMHAYFFHINTIFTVLCFICILHWHALITVLSYFRTDHTWLRVCCLMVGQSFHKRFCFALLFFVNNKSYFYLWIGNFV